MAGRTRSRETLLDFLNQKAFEPVLKASPDGCRNEIDRKTLEDVQRRTKSEKERFAGYESAEKVKRMFEDDLDSSAAKKVQAELKKLGLPTLPDLKDEFEKLCQDCGVN